MGVRASVLLLSAMAVAASAGSTPSFAQRAPDDPRVLLRLGPDSGVVGHYRIRSKEVQRLIYEIPEGDPRAALLSSVTGPWERTTGFALTMVVGDQQSEDVRRYIIYLLGYRLSGDEVRSLTAAQWDSIFQDVGRQAVLKVSPTGELRGVEVSGEAVRPVGEALAGILAGAALRLPTDTVAVGSSWQGRADVPVRRPDGTRVAVIVTLTYRLTGVTEEAGGRFARIEFDGAPVSGPHDATGVSGHYFGEALFAIDAGRYDELIAQAELEVGWRKGENGLPPSRSKVHWEATISRVLGGSG